MGLGIAGIERESDLMFGNCFLILADLDEAESERVVSLNKIGIDLHSFLKMLGGCADFAGLRARSNSFKALVGMRSWLTGTGFADGGLGAGFDSGRV